MRGGVGSRRRRGQKNTGVFPSFTDRLDIMYENLIMI